MFSFSWTTWNNWRERKLDDRTFKQIPHFAPALFNRLSIASVASSVLSFPPRAFSPEIPFSRAGVNLFPLSLALSHAPFLLTLPKRFCRMPTGWNIRLPNYWKQQRGAVSLRLAFSPVFFVCLCPLWNPNFTDRPHYPGPFSLLMESPPGATLAESQIRIFDVCPRVTY